MCGIFGLFPKSRKLSPAWLSVIKHRGPDDAGWIDAGLGILGHTGLSIIDLSSQASQPMLDETGNFVLVFNGEIYNYQEIKSELEDFGIIFRTQSDTEVVLKSYIAWGEQCLNRFRGMFAFCLLDKTKGELFLARDRFGIKPLIYSFLNGQFIFCSELVPLIKAGLISRNFCMESVCDFFKYGTVKQPKTILEGVYHLMP